MTTGKLSLHSGRMRQNRHGREASENPRGRTAILTSPRIQGVALDTSLSISTNSQTTKSPDSFVCPIEIGGGWHGLLVSRAAPSASHHCPSHAHLQPNQVQHG